MIKRKLWGLLYILIVLGTLAAAEWGCRTVSVMVEAAPLKRGNCIIIDAGHGGEDGGATSCRGVLESTYNLEISLRLNDLLHLLGYDTRMIRTTDTSIYTKGETIAQKKISDLKERVRIVNKTENALLLSIHQNNFTDSRYSGAQMFYSKDNAEGEKLAGVMQKQFVSLLQPDNTRETKPVGDELYLLNNTKNPAVMIECGFLSNPEEAQKLENEDYQRQVAFTVLTGISEYRLMQK